MTLYILHGFAKAAEFGVDVPKDMTQRALGLRRASTTATEWTRCMALNGCWEFITFLNYVVSAYPDASLDGRRRHGGRAQGDARLLLQALEGSTRRTSRGYLALTLKRMGRPADARPRLGRP